MIQQNDLDRLRTIYEERNIRLANSDLYSVFNPSYLFMWQQRQRSLIQLLSKTEINSLPHKKILEVGCGSGRVLTEFLSLGAKPELLFGIDLLLDRVSEAHQLLPGSGIACADGQNLPFPEQTFDLIIQYTVFSSILDPGIKVRVATNMLRLLKPNSFILWYDFWLNPTNQQTRGIHPVEIRRLFPNCAYEFHKITLAPPLARRIVPFSWSLALFLESLKIFNTHYLAVIRSIYH
jgi:SAM-dependent methyltransferase